MSVEELASIYVSELRAFYPTGPYLLGGLSFGGLVALEMSQQLWTDGAEPGALVLFDTSAPGSARFVRTRDQISTFWQNLRVEGVDYVARVALRKMDYWRKLSWKRVQAVRCTCHRLVRRELPTELRYYLVRESHTGAMERYRVRPYPGKITLIRVQERVDLLSEREDPNLGWGAFAKGALDIYDVPSDHLTILREPFVWSVAEKLNAILPL
jgi:aspartate racemase